MSTYFISRHAGAIAWAKEEGLAIDEVVTHLDGDIQLQAGDVVMGTLPVNMIADLCEQGIEFHFLSMNIPPEARGKELTANEMREYGISLVRYKVERY